MPGQPGGRYEANNESGTLTIDASGTGAYRPVVALLGQGGIYREVESGVMIAQHLGDGIVMLDPDVLATLDQPKRSGTSENPPWGGGGGGVQPRTGPKLCLDPVPERGGSADPMASEYQQFVRDHVNGQRFPQMPPELTIALPAETPTGRVWYDDCDELNGDMIEAKSNTSGFLYGKEGSKRIAAKFLEQAMRQIKAMGSSRKGRWYLRDKGYYDFTKQIFESKGLSDKIGVHYLPYPNPKKFKISSMGRGHDGVYS
ncbi:MAG: hypothetical protein P4L76_04165 [Beijerinckiaceae bacterium]|nr:hypothetical protein [Beijerinckiaceae bacterium]